MTLTKLPFDPFSLKNTIGFDDMFRKLSSLDGLPIPNYPPYNIRKTGETAYAIDIAVAGFKRDELDISLEDGVLTVVGAIKAETKDEYIHKGIADRAFTRKFTLADNVLVKYANITDGILSIDLERIIPEEKKAKKIAIGGATLDAGAQLLQEGK